MAGKPGELLAHARTPEVGLVRVQSYRRPAVDMFLREGYGAPGRLQVESDDEDGADPGQSRTLEHVGTVVVEVVELKVGVSVEEGLGH